MAKFLTYDINQVIINNNLFPANSISFQLAANTVPVRDINGNLLYYSPTSPIQGSVSINFFLTGAIPSYLRLENQNEIANTIAFNQLAVPGCHLTNLSFSVRPFEPIPVKADFVFYHGIRALNTNSLIVNSLNEIQVTKNVSSLKQSFNSGLNILNGVSSYIITDDRSTYIQNPADFVVTDFDYQFSVERVPILRVGEYFPLRVAMKEINAEFNITASNLDGVLDIKGNSAVFSAVLKDNTDANVSDTINVTGIIVNQSYEISEDNFGFSKIKMMQSLNKKRSSITIPMEVNNPNIVNPPTNNNNVDIKPPTHVPGKEIEDSIKPDPTDLNKGRGTGTSDSTGPVDNDDYFYYVILFDFSFYATGQYMKDRNRVNQKFTNVSRIEGRFVDTDFSNSQINHSYYFKVEGVVPGLVYLKQDSDDQGLPRNFWRATDALGVKFKVNKKFKEAFNLGKIYNLKSPDVFFRFDFSALTTTDNIPARYQNFTYDDVWTLVNGPTIGNGTENSPYIYKGLTQQWAGVGNNPP